MADRVVECTPQVPADPSTQRRNYPSRMPPQPGLFAVPHGTSASHTQAGFTSGPSSAATQMLGTIPPVGPGMGLALVGGTSKNSRLESQQKTFDQRDGSLTGARAGVSKASGEVYGQGHQQQQHSHLNSHNHHLSHNAGAGPSTRNIMEDGRKEKKRKESSRTGKDNGDRRDDPRHYTESINALHAATHMLSTRPETYELYRLRLYPLTIERSALLAQYEFEERYSIECAQVAYDEERERVEEEWRRGRERVRERLLEGIEERRRRAREEKEGEGTIGDAVLDAHSRPPITRKLRNKLGTSPPPTPQGNHHPLSLSTFSANAGNAGGTLLSANLPITMGPFPNPHSLSVEDLPSPFPLPLTSSQLPHSSGGAGGIGAAASAAGAGAANGNRRRVKGGGAHQGQAIGGLGKSLLALNTNKDNDLENDLGEIRRGNKRRRATAAASMAKTGAGL